MRSSLAGGSKATQRQNQSGFVARGPNEGWYPHRWFAWIELRREWLGLNPGVFQKQIVERAPSIIPVPTVPNKKNWNINEVYRRAKRGKTHRSFQAFWIGETLKTIEQDARDEAYCSGLESLAFGGYYGDLIATIGLATTQDATLEVIRAAGTLASHLPLRTLPEPGIHGWSTVIPDYAGMIERKELPAEIPETAPFREAFMRWLQSGRNLPLPWIFDGAHRRIAAGDETHGLELLMDGVKLASMQRQIRDGLVIAVHNAGDELLLDNSVWAFEELGADAAAARARLIGADGSAFLRGKPYSEISE